MAKKTIIDLSADSDVAGSSSEITTAPAAVPSGKIARITRFGGTCPRDTNLVESMIVLQWGSGGSWKTIRAIASSFGDIALDKEYVGDGTKTFRLIRSNRSTASKPMVAWLEGFIV
jgi:hypothetical protein